jgi:energy-converting hydrogenase Eha subunit E
MCWSADADLAAGSVIMAVGVGCVAGVRRPRDIPLAALPLLLGLHQVVESVVWRGQDGMVSASAASTARTLWAVIAFPLLPLLVPVAVLLTSSPAARPVRRRLQALTVVGAATSAVLAVTLAQHPVTARVLGHTMGYSIDVPVAALIIAGYLAATLGALVLASDPTLRALGVITTVGAAACYLVWELAFASTWCALAAVASLILLRWAWSPRPRLAPDAQAARAAGG